jgi:hypothetical protein
MVEIDMSIWTDISIEVHTKIDDKLSIKKLIHEYIDETRFTLVDSKVNGSIREEMYNILFCADSDHALDVINKIKNDLEAKTIFFELTIHSLRIFGHRKNIKLINTDVFLTDVVEYYRDILLCCHHYL